MSHNGVKPVMQTPEFGTWIKVSDQLPTMKPAYNGGPQASEAVLVFSGYYVGAGRYVETYAKRIPGWKAWPMDRCINVTHWMPFPDPPSVKVGC